MGLELRCSLLDYPICPLASSGQRQEMVALGATAFVLGCVGYVGIVARKREWTWVQYYLVPPVGTGYSEAATQGRLPCVARLAA